MINHPHTNGPPFRSTQERLPLDDDADDEFSRILTPETAGEFYDLDRELRDGLTRIDRRYKQIVMDLRRRQAPTDDIAKVEQEKRELIEHRKEEFRKTLRALVDDLMGDT